MVIAEFRHERFSFRFTELQPETAERLWDLAPEGCLHSRRADVIVWDGLHPKTDFSWLYDFLQGTQLDPNSYGIWVSATTSSDGGTVAVPPYILELVRATKCRIDFSFFVCIPCGNTTLRIATEQRRANSSDGNGSFPGGDMGESAESNAGILTLGDAIHTSLQQLDGDTRVCINWEKAGQTDDH
jgi:hypothetical protein